MSKQKVAKNTAEDFQVKQVSKPLLFISLGLFVLSFLLYSNTLNHGFVLDDALSIGLNKNVTAGIDGISKIISGSYRDNNFGGQLYRPVSLIQFAIEWDLSPDNPTIHHFFSIFWYSCTVAMVFWVSYLWFGSSMLWLSVLIAAMFAVHPIHTEVVANIKSRDEIMSLFFILGSYLSWHFFMIQKKNMWAIISIVLYFLALMSKESAVTMFPIYGLLVWFVYKKSMPESVIKGAIFLVPVMLLFLIRYSLFGGQAAPEVSVMDNPMKEANGFVVHFSTSMVVLLQYFKLLIYPYPLSCDYSYTVISLTDFSNPKVWLSLVIHVLLLLFGLRLLIKRSFMGLPILGYLMGLVLFSQLLMIIGTMFGERLAYLASFWFVVGSLYGLKVAFEYYNLNTDKVLLTSLAFPIIIFSWLTLQRNGDWKSNFSLFTKDAATYPSSVRLHNGAAEETLKQADLTQDVSQKAAMMQKAEDYCNHIMKIKPVPTAYLTLGNIRLKQQKYDEAIQYYDQVNDLKSIVDINKALAYREMARNAGQVEQDISKAQNLLQESVKLNPNDAETWFLTGVSYGVSGNHQLAGENFEKAYQLNPTPEYIKNVISAYQNAGNQSKVLAYNKLLQQ
jgi:tetratricopeptide (TPR) repeat protein